MSSDALNQLLAVLKVQANVFHNGQYCGVWAVDTSGSNLMNFHVVSHGTCVIEVEGKEHNLQAGDAVFMPTDTSHRIRDNTSAEALVNQSPSISMLEPVDEPATGLVCGHFTHQHPVFDRLLAQLPKVIIVKRASDSTGTEIVDLILSESKSSGQSTNFLLNRLADALFFVLLRDNLNTNSGVLAAMSHPKLSKSIAVIHSTMDQALSVDVLAEYSNMSRSAFSTLFKEVVSQSPAEYISHWRMTQAYRWLADDRVSTYEAAIRCGYESEASFSKAFKRVTGLGPGEVRQMNK